MAAADTGPAAAKTRPARPPGVDAGGLHETGPLRENPLRQGLLQDAGQFVGDGIPEPDDSQFVCRCGFTGVEPFDQALDVLHVGRAGLHEHCVGTGVVGHPHEVRGVGLARVPRVVKLRDEGRHLLGACLFERERPQGVAGVRLVELLDFLDVIIKPQFRREDQDGVRPAQRQHVNRVRRGQLLLGVHPAQTALLLLRRGEAAGAGKHLVHDVHDFDRVRVFHLQDAHLRPGVPPLLEEELLELPDHFENQVEVGLVVGRDDDGAEFVERIDEHRAARADEFKAARPGLGGNRAQGGLLPRLNLGEIVLAAKRGRGDQSRRCLPRISGVVRHPPDVGHRII